MEQQYDAWLSSFAKVDVDMINQTQAVTNANGNGVGNHTGGNDATGIQLAATGDDYGYPGFPGGSSPLVDIDLDLINQTQAVTNANGNGVGNVTGDNDATGIQVAATDFGVF